MLWKGLRLVVEGFAWAGVLGIVVPPLAAGPGLWTSKGPYGGKVKALAIDPANPATIYAGTELNGVFKSADGATSWTSASKGLESGSGDPPGYTSTLSISDLAINPDAPGELYAATGTGLYKTADGAGSWVEVGKLEIGVGTLAVVVAPSASKTVYAGTFVGVFRSLDGGETWDPVNGGLPGGDVLSLAVDPTDSETVYAAVEDRVFKTTDGGASWQSASVGLPLVDMWELVVDPGDPDRVYVAASDGVYRTLDGASSWSRLRVPVTVWGAVAVDPQDSSTIYAGSVFVEGLLKSVDAGETWERVDTADFFDASIVELAIDPFDPSRVYAGVRGAGLFRSLDAGGSWELATKGLAAFQVSSVLVDPEAPSILYAAGSGGVWKSVNGGESWEPRPDGLTTLLGLVIQDTALDPEQPTTLYAGTFTGGVYKSTDGAASWLPANNGLSETQIESLAIDPQAPQTVYAGTVFSLFKTMDGGQSWSHADAGLTGDFVLDIAIDPQAPANLYAGTSDGAFKSTNGGASWGLLEPFGDNTVDTIALDPQATCTVYADYLGGLGTSLDCGEGWDAGSPGGDVALVEVDPANSSNLYVLVKFDGLYRSIDGGASWELFNDGFANVAVQALAFDAETPRRLYAATLGGVYEMLLGGLFEDGFESGDTSAWDLTVP